MSARVGSSEHRLRWRSCSIAESANADPVTLRASFQVERRQRERRAHDISPELTSLTGWALARRVERAQGLPLPQVEGRVETSRDPDDHGPTGPQTIKWKIRLFG